VGLAFLVAAPLALPLIEYTQRSTRAYMGVDQVSAFSLPVASLVGMLFPDFHGNHEWVVYAGGIGLVLALFALVASPVRSGKIFWGSVLSLSLIFALGVVLPGFDWLARIPGIDLLMVPAVYFFWQGWD
jgi:hypothetical protein